MLRQAEENVCLEMKKSLNSMIASVIKKEANSQMLSNKVFEFVKEAIKERHSSDYVLKLSDELVKSASSALFDEIKNGLVIEGFGKANKGFRLKEKDGSGYYDFSIDELVSLMQGYLSKSVDDAINASVKSIE